MRMREIIRRPLITEKATLQGEGANIICFEVAKGANKIEIRKAVEELFDVKVESVRVLNRKGKPTRRYGRVVGHRSSVRKAYVRLTPDSKAPEFFEGV